MKVGDVVRSTKGDRFTGPKRFLKVVELGKKWRHYNAVVCEDMAGLRHIYLTKNLEPIPKSLQERVDRLLYLIDNYGEVETLPPVSGETSMKSWQTRAIRFRAIDYTLFEEALKELRKM